MTNLELRPYQQEAVDRIVERKSLLVAYEMGLGKGALMTRAIEELMAAREITETVLVIAPSTLKFQLAKEIMRWAPESRAVPITGTPKQRTKLYEECADADYVVVGYETLVRDFAYFGSRRWGAVVVDELSHIKSFRSKRAKAVKKVAQRVPVRVGLTGTPITNGKPEEIFSLMEFVDPDVLGRRFDLFDRTFIVRNGFGGVERYRNLPLLHRTLAPAMVRKRQSDEDVAPYLPDVQDIDPEIVPFDRAGLALYRTIAADLVDVLDEAMDKFGSGFRFNVAAHYGQGVEQFDPETAAITGEIMTRMQALRMLCSHPEALRVSAAKYAARIASDGLDPGPGPGSAYAYSLRERGLLGPSLRAPKMDAVVARTKDWLDVDPTYKIVLFSFFRDVLPLLGEALAAFNPQMYHGGLTDVGKEASKTRFQTDPEARVLLSSDAGGYGVDLPQANLLINYDLPWTAADALQRNSRIIRVSSQWPSVRVERFLMAGSLEIRQWEMLAHKTAVSEAIVDGARTDQSGNVFTSVSSLREALVSDI